MPSLETVKQARAQLHAFLGGQQIRRGALRDTELVELASRVFDFSPDLGLIEATVYVDKLGRKERVKRAKKFVGDSVNLDSGIRQK